MDMDAMQWFDAECRLGTFRLHQPKAPTTAQALVGELEANGISRALVYHADAIGYDPMEGNQRLLAAIKGWPQLEPCWVVLPHHTGEMPPSDAVVRMMLDAGVSAARIFPRTFRVPFRVWALDALLSALAAHRIPLWVDFGHQGWSEEAIDFEGLYEIAQAFPELPIVLVRPNIGTERGLYPLMERCPQLYVETSYYTVHRGIERLSLTFGPQRILFGTGLPDRAPGPAITALSYSALTPSARSAIAGGNLTRLLSQVEAAHGEQPKPGGNDDHDTA